jgi:hypothetical protein
MLHIRKTSLNSIEENTRVNVKTAISLYKSSVNTEASNSSVGSRHQRIRSLIGIFLKHKLVKTWQVSDLFNYMIMNTSFEYLTNYQFNMPSISWTRICKYLLSWKANKLKDRKIQNSKLNLTVILQLSLSNLSFTWLQHSVATSFYFNTNISNPSPPSIALRLTNCYCIGSRQYHI